MLVHSLSVDEHGVPTNMSMATGADILASTGNPVHWCVSAVLAA